MSGKTTVTGEQQWAAASAACSSTLAADGVAKSAFGVAIARAKPSPSPSAVSSTNCGAFDGANICPDSRSMDSGTQFSQDEEDTLSLDNDCAGMEVEEQSKSPGAASPDIVAGTHQARIISDDEWKIGWSRWSVSRRRARLAQFIVEHLHTGNHAKWIDITIGKFELNSWPAIAKEWFDQKERGSEISDATSILKKGLPRAFPEIQEIRLEALKEGTQYLKRVFVASSENLADVRRLAESPMEDTGSSDEQSQKPKRMMPCDFLKKDTEKSKGSTPKGASYKKKKTKMPKGEQSLSPIVAPAQSTVSASPGTPLNLAPASPMLPDPPGSCSSPPSVAGASEESFFQPFSEAANSPPIETGYGSRSSDTQSMDVQNHEQPQQNNSEHVLLFNELVDNDRIKDSDSIATLKLHAMGVPEQEGATEEFSEELLAMLKREMNPNIHAASSVNVANIPLVRPEAMDMEFPDYAESPAVPGEHAADLAPDLSAGDGGNDNAQILQQQQQQQHVQARISHEQQIQAMQVRQARISQEQQIQAMQLQQLNEQTRRQQQQQSSLFQQQTRGHAASAEMQGAYAAAMQQQTLQLQQASTVMRQNGLNFPEQQQQQQGGAYPGRSNQQVPGHGMLPTFDQSAGIHADGGNFAVPPTASPMMPDRDAHATAAASRGMHMGFTASPGSSNTAGMGDTYSKICPNKSTISGGEQFLIIKCGTEPILDGPVIVQFISERSQTSVSVQMQRDNPYTVVGIIPPHCRVETVMVYIKFPQESVFKLSFEYIGEPRITPTYFDGDITELHSFHELFGTFMHHQAAGMHGNTGAGMGNSQMFNQGNVGAQYQRYCQLLHMAVQLDARPLVRLLLQLPAAEFALTEVFSDGKCLKDVAKERGFKQLSNCLVALQTRYERGRSGQEGSSTLDPFDLLECPSSAAANCVASICTALNQLRISKQASSTSDSATGNLPVVADAASFGGNSADDENSEPDLPVQEYKMGKRRSSAEVSLHDESTSQQSAEFSSTQSRETTPAASDADRPIISTHLKPLSYPMGRKALSDVPMPDSSSAFSRLPDVSVAVPLLQGTTDSTTGAAAEPAESASDKELVNQLQQQNRDLLVENSSLGRELHELNGGYQAASMQTLGMQCATSLLKEQCEQVSQRRDEAIKAMVVAKNESRRWRRDAEKYQSLYVDAMRQRDEALAIVDAGKAETAHPTHQNSFSSDAQDGNVSHVDWASVAKKHEDEKQRLEGECQQLKTSLQASVEMQEGMKSQLDLLENTMKQSELKTRDLQNLQDMHYSMADELRNTKAELHAVSQDRDDLTQELKIAQRESESAIRRGIWLQQNMTLLPKHSPALPDEDGETTRTEFSAPDSEDVQEKEDAADQLKELKTYHEELISEHRQVEDEYSKMKVEHDSLLERLHNVDFDVEKARSDRDWAIDEYHKALEERDSLRHELEALRLEKDQAIEDSFKARKQVGELQGRQSQDSKISSDKSALPEHQTIIRSVDGSAPARSHSPKSDRAGVQGPSPSRRPQRRPTMDSRRSADDSALGSLDTATLLSGGETSHGEAPTSPETKPEVYTFQFPPKTKDFGLILEQATFINGIRPGSLAEKQGIFSRGDIIISANNASILKSLTVSEMRKLLRAPKHQGTILTCLSTHKQPPSDFLPKSEGGEKQDSLAHLQPSQSSATTSVEPSQVSPSPSLSARVVGKFGNISPVVNRFRRSTSMSSANQSNVSTTDLQTIGKEYVLREGLEPGRCSRRDSLSSQSSCTYSSVSNLTGVLPEDCVSQVSQMDACVPRRVTIRMQPGFGVGFKIQGGNCSGLFVTGVREDGPAHSLLQRGDQLLSAGEHDLRHCSLEKAVSALKKLEGDVKITVQFNPAKFQFMREPAFDSFYLRCQFDYARESDAELSIRRGDILHVVNSATSDYSYLAWKVNSDGSETQFGVVPNMQRACGLQKVYLRKILDNGSSHGSSEDVRLAPYIPVERKPATLPRPVLLCGTYCKDIAVYLHENYPDRFGRCVAMSSFSTRKEMDRELVMNVLIEYQEDNGHFSSTSVEGVREVAKQNQHCLLSIKPSSVTQLCLADLQPIVVQTKVFSASQATAGAQALPLNLPECDSETENDVDVDAVVSGDTVQSLVRKVLEEVMQNQDKPIWCEVM
eukprot:scpid10881/ scgid14475/ Disks large homolog 4; Postsynaptic density protein 95; Synapse-associated protein 90